MKYYILFIVFLLAGPLMGQNANDEVILKAMQDELDRNMKELSLPDMPKPFYLSYTLGLSRQFEVIGTLGALTSSYEQPSRGLGTVQLLLGDYTRTSDTRYTGQFTRTGMPAEAAYEQIRTNFWLGSDVAYKNALQEAAAKTATLKANPLPEEEATLTDLVKITPVTKIVTDKTPYSIDMPALEEKVRELSAVFREYKELFNSSVIIGGIDMDVYKKTSEGVTFKEPVSYVNLIAQASVRTKEGVKINDTYSMAVARPQDLPSMEELRKSIKQFADGLVKLKEAPEVDEFYSGPILFEDGASSAVFVNNLLNQTGLFAYRKPLSGRNQPLKTIEGRIGKKIIDTRLTIKNYSTLDKYEGKALLGAYQIDAEGVVPEKELTLVEKGILKNMLNGRVPALKSPASTGSSRFLLTNTDLVYVTAPGTVHIQVEKGLKPDKMKKALIKAAKEEGLEYAYIVRKIAGPASLIYRVSVKDGSEMQVRFGELSAVNLAKIKRVLEISAKENVSNYILNRQVLSSLIYPSSVLIEDVEISKAAVKPEKEPALLFPLQRQ